jgi:hemerythrin-like domain-containing protein
MAKPPDLLNSDGSASMATLLMLSHHAFRRDLSRFARALTSLNAVDDARIQALRDEWRHYHGALHGHDQMEDNAVFPQIKSQHPELSVCIEGLAADHGQIDPLLEQGDRAFDKLPQTAAALGVVRELQALLSAHLATEESELIPHLRAAKDFPPPPNEAMADMYAEGFAWSSHGIAADVLTKVYALLPPLLTSRLPAARAAFDRRCERVWGSAKAGAARTAIPEP